MESYGSAVEYLKDVVTSIGSSKVQDIAGTRNLYMALSKVEQTAKIAPETELVANVNLAGIEEVLNSKFISLNKSMQVVLINIYGLLLFKTPGYVVRNIMIALLNACNNKVVQVGTRECVISIISIVMEKRSLDIGSMLTDLVNTMIRLIRGTETTVRLLALQAITNLLSSVGSKVSEFHLECSKLCSKLNSDRSPDIRQKNALLIGALSSSSNGFTTIPIDNLLQPALKGLEDEINFVQEAYAKSIALINLELINAHLEDLEQTKIGLARGGSSSSSSSSSSDSRGKLSQRGSLSKLKDITSFKDIMSSSVNMTTQQKKSSEETNDFKTIIKNLIKNMIKSSSSVLRAGYISVLRQLIQMLIPTILQDTNNIEWLVMTLIHILKDPQITSLSYEEIVYFRCRLSHLFHYGITCYLSEPNQILLCKTLNLYLSTTDVRTEHEIQIILCELSHIIQSLQEISISLQDEIKSMINIQLRNSSFGVRATAASVLMSLASVLPANASSYFKDALTGAAIQVKQLLSFDESDYNSSTNSSSSTSNNSETIPTEESGPSNTNSNGNKKSPKDTERLQRMFYFHGINKFSIFFFCFLLLYF